MSDELLPVEQCDRDGVADYLISMGAVRAGAEYDRLLRSGGCDGTSTVQAFARHRLAALSSTPK